MQKNAKTKSIKQKNKTNYNAHYFQERDLLDVHLAETIRLYLQKHNAQKVLDVGCGSGRLIAYLRRHKYTTFGVDSAPEAVTMARRYNPRHSIHLASGLKLPFKKNSMDAVLAISVIEHIDKNKTQAFLKEIKRVLTPHGVVFLVTPNYAAPWRMLQGKHWFGYSDPTHVVFFTPWSLAGKLRNSGFNDVRFWFKTMYNPPYQWELPGIFSRLPNVLKIIVTYLLISTPVCFIRNSFWIAAQVHPKSKQ